MSKENQIKRDIQKDIDDIKLLLSNKQASIEELKELHIRIDGKYQNTINNIGYGCYNWYEKYGFDYNIGVDSLRLNLSIMKSKLEGYLQTFSLVPLASTKTVNNIFKNENVNKNENSNSNTNVNKFEINFKIIQETINNMESLTSDDTKEALEKLNELEKIYNSEEPRKAKWETVKKILVWVANKSVDIAIAFFPVIMNILS